MAHRLCSLGLGAPSMLGLLRSAMCLHRAYRAASSSSSSSSSSSDSLPEPLEVSLDAWGTCCRDPYKSGKTAAQPWRGTECCNMDCGEDSFFITPRVLGVADGVGGWRSEGVDPAVFANKLMQNCKSFVEQGVTDPIALMKMAYKTVLTLEEVNGGGCTVCLAAVGPKGLLRVANLGDSGLLLVRDGKCIFQAEEKVFQFNTPFQLAMAPRGSRVQVFGSQPEDSALESITVQPGDVIVMGSDGLLDNLYPEQIASVVANGQEQVASPRQLAEALKDFAFAAALDSRHRSPFQAAAEKHRLRYQGGKPDDITVIVAVVTPA